MSLQTRYDEAMFAFSQGDYPAAIAKLEALLAEDPGYFDALLSLGMAYFRLGDTARAIQEGHRAEQMRPDEQLVHTNLSLFYLKLGDKEKAELHGLRARVASWKGMGAPGASAPATTLPQAKTPPTPIKFPAMPWKKSQG